MPAAALQQVAAELDALEHVEAGDGAGGPFAVRLLVVDADDDGGPVVGVYQLARDDADDAGVPAGRSDDQDLRLVQVQPGDDQLGFFQDTLLSLLALDIEGVHLLDQKPGFLGVAGQHEIEGDGGIIEPADGVDSRADAEADRLGGKRLVSLDARAVQQGAQADFAGDGKLFQAEGSKYPVFAQQRHDIGDGAAGDEV